MIQFKLNEVGLYGTSVIISEYSFSGNSYHVLCCSWLPFYFGIPLALFLSFFFFFLSFFSFVFGILKWRYYMRRVAGPKCRLNACFTGLQKQT